MVTTPSPHEYLTLLRKIASGRLNRRQVVSPALAVGLGATALTKRQTATAAIGEQQTHVAMVTQTLGPESIDAEVDGIEADIKQLGLDLWNISEPSLLEVHSGQRVMDALTPHGFTITSKGTAGHKTAFIAEWGSGEPRVGFLAEYDALLGLGNAAVPQLQGRDDGNTVGHGCGHNLLGAGCVGAAIALKEVMAANDLPGTIRLYGCAAEETEGAKVYMARAGLFDDLDAALHWHPSPLAATAHVHLTALDDMTAEFFGKTAHAGTDPWNGRSAVDAAELFAHSINLMREHVLPTSRLQYVYDEAGLAPNIVPDYAKMRVRVRGLTRPDVVGMTDWMRQAVDGAAEATQTTGELTVYFGCWDLISNTPLAEASQRQVKRVGLPQFSEDEQRWAKDLQQVWGVDRLGLNTTVTALPATELIGGGSTDVGDVAWSTPAMGLSMPTVPLGIPMHTWAATASHAQDFALRSTLHVAKALGALGLEVMTDENLRQEARADWELRKAGIAYEPAIPAEQISPVGTPNWLMNADNPFDQALAEEAAAQT